MSKKQVSPLFSMYFRPSESERSLKRWGSDVPLTLKRLKTGLEHRMIAPWNESSRFFNEKCQVRHAHISHLYLPTDLSSTIDRLSSGTFKSRSTSGEVYQVNSGPLLAGWRQMSVSSVPARSSQGLLLVNSGQISLKFWPKLLHFWYRIIEVLPPTNR